MNKTLLENEIRQQPEVIKRFIDKEGSGIADIACVIKDRFEYIMVAARGSSDNAARYGQYLFGTRNRIPVALAAPSIFTIYNKPLSLSNSLLIGISQSGQSPDIVEVILEGRAQNRPTIAITNDRNSPLSRASEYVIDLGAGVEKAVAATKTYTTSLLALALISIHLSGDESALLELQKMPSFMEKSLKAIDHNFSHVERYRYMTHCAVVGRGLNYSTAFEMSLKIKELTRVVAEPYSSADFHHGPIAMVRDGFPVIVIAPSSVLNEDMDHFCQDVLNRKGELIVISDQEQILAKAHYPIALPKDIPEWLSPMAAIVPGQLFALNLALIKNMDPDHPPGIQKITETY